MSADGYVLMPVETVKTAAARMIEQINKSRSEYFREVVNNHLYWANLRWKYFWKWLGFKKPTRRSGIHHFFYDNTYVINHHRLIRACLCGEQYFICKDLKDAAELTEGEQMLVSVYAVKKLGL